MSNYLTIGSVVQLQNGDTKVMIINRFPLYNNRGTIGYFDYSACLYPSGNTDNQVYFFNHENIDKI
ncbi:Putative EsaC protein analog (Listeria type 3) [Streptococcus australis]|uniref:EsaC protein analog (Listeria type 3) n=1 Tax=Streptococcus australis TaxID=113107 RepID=A0A4V0BQP9_9STRE|nr:Putative EsaC protein analog (Listeria type 3) [Streptococcus australis]